MFKVNKKVKNYYLSECAYFAILIIERRLLLVQYQQIQLNGRFFYKMILEDLFSGSYRAVKIGRI